MTRGNNFDALRLLGALAVLVSHQFALMGLDQPMLGNYDAGDVALFMFFAISGYLVAGSWQSDPDGFRFIARRALRMGPGWVVLMAVTLAIYAVGNQTFPDNPYTQFNGSLWTLEWEILCYVVLGVLALFLPMKALAVLALIVLVPWWDMATIKTYQELGVMFAGGVALRAFGVPRTVKTLAPILGLAAYFIMRGSHFPAMMILIPLLSISVGNASWPYMRNAGRFGDFSYGIYIYAFPVQQFGVLWLGTDQPYGTMLAVSLVVTGALAVLSWHLVEAPGLRMKSYLRPQLFGNGAAGGVKEAV